MGLKLTKKQIIQIRFILFKYKIKCFFGKHKFFTLLHREEDRIVECLNCGKLKKIITN
jgi:hypothetical protein